MKSSMVERQDLCPMATVSDWQHEQTEGMETNQTLGLIARLSGKGWETDRILSATLPHTCLLVIFEDFFATGMYYNIDVATFILLVKLFRHLYINFCSLFLEYTPAWRYETQSRFLVQECKADVWHTWYVSSPL